MVKVDMDIESICQNANAILNRLTYVNSSINISKSIKSAFDSEARELLLPDINFWIVVWDNCMFRALLELAKTYEEGQDVIGIQKLINQVSQTKPSTNKKALVQESQEKYDVLKSSRDKLRTLRDKGLAHADKEYLTDLECLVSEYGLSSAKIDELINSAAEICNDILIEFSGEGRSVAVALNDDASGIIRDVKLAHEVRETRCSQ